MVYRLAIVAAGPPVAQIVITLRNGAGLHVPTAGIFVQTAKRFRSQIKVTHHEKEADGKSVLSLLKLEAVQGSFISVAAIGEDAREAVHALHSLILDKFGEPD